MQTARQAVGRGHHHRATRNPAQMASPPGRQQMGFFQPTHSQTGTTVRHGRDRTVGAPIRTENPGWGYDRIVGALANLGYHISDQTVGNILKRHGLGPAPERKRNTTWAQFIRRHKEVLWATDFFTAEVWTPTGLTTFYVLFFLHLQTRRIVLAGITPFPGEAWLKQVARNLTVDDGPMTNARYLLHDRDAKFSPTFDDVFL